MMLILSHRRPTVRVACQQTSDFQATVPAVDESLMASPTPAAPVQGRPEPPDRLESGARLLTPWTSRDRRTPMSQRRLFRHQLDQSLSVEGGAGSTLAVLVIDLEGLAPIAETHGPEAGDLVLQIVAARLGRAVRSSDVISRIGYQEFGCLLSGALDRQQLGHVADKMCDALTAPLRIGALWLYLNPSLGIAHGAACDSGAAGMLLGASSAMLRAKHQRSGYAFFDPPSRRPVRRGAPVTPFAAEVPP